MLEKFIIFKHVIRAQAFNLLETEFLFLSNKGNIAFPVQPLTDCATVTLGERQAWFFSFQSRKPSAWNKSLIRRHGLLGPDVTVQTRSRV